MRSVNQLQIDFLFFLLGTYTLLAEQDDTTTKKIHLDIKLPVGKFQKLEFMS